MNTESKKATCLVQFDDRSEEKGRLCLINNQGSVIYFSWGKLAWSCTAEIWYNERALLFWKINDERRLWQNFSGLISYVSSISKSEFLSDKEWVFSSRESSINHLEEGINSQLIKFVDNTKLGGVATTNTEVRQKACSDSR